MKILKICLTTFAIIFCCMGNFAWAVMPVIDDANLAKAIIQVQSWQQQYGQMVQQIQQLQQQYFNLNGVRGMGNLVNNPASRKYMPADYQTILKNGYGSSAQIRSAAKVFGVEQTTLDESSDSAKAFNAVANQAAINRAMSEDAYKKASERFADIQVLLDKLNEAPDAKDMADLQGRIQVEQVMLQNESNKLQMLAQLAQAQRDLQVQQAREISMKSSKGGLPAGW